MTSENDRPPVFSPVGERGPLGDPGKDGGEGKRGLPGSQGRQGPQGIPGSPIYVSPTRFSKTAQVFLALGVLLASVSILLALLFAWQEVGQLRERVDQVYSDRAEEQRNEDCRDFYQVDLSSALGKALAANNALWVAIGGRDAAITDEDRVADALENQELAQVLASENQPLLDAAAALTTYQNMSPRPELCPHPDAVALREAEQRDNEQND